ncbi:MAG: DNA polymerase Y family protein [Pseudomonadales bacterium]|nr:DNA polymerase Y family protein [Pseudomonadales bacterium]
MLWMCLHFPKLALEIYTRNQDIETPFAIEETQNNKRLVLLCNKQAAAEGIQAGITLPTAHGLCEQLIVKERNDNLERKTLQQIASHISPFSPTITLQAPNTILLEISSCLTLFGGLKNLHEKIQTQIQKINYSFKLTVAKTPLAAELAAELIEEKNKYLINEAYLKQIPISALNYRLPNSNKQRAGQSIQRDMKTLQRLQGMGFRRLGELLALPKPELGRRFGKPFLIYLDKLTGVTLDTRETFELPTYFEDHIHFVEELTALNSLLFPLKRLLTNMEHYLQQRQQATASIVILLENRLNQIISIDIEFAEPQCRKDKILPLIYLRFETLTLSEPIITVGLKANQLMEQQIKTNSLFSQDSSVFSNEETNSDRANLISRLTARLGNEQVKSLMLAEDHRPESCWSYTSPATQIASNNIHRKKTHRNKEDKNKTQKNRKSEQAQQPRPLWLLPQPQQLPYRKGQLFWHGPLALLSGPERIDTAWWDNKPVNRDYYIARHHRGELLWIFKKRTRTLATTQVQSQEKSQWFLHGIFS